jgi:MoxR-like ATPase
VNEMQSAVVDVHVSDAVRDYILDITEATRREPRLKLGLSPRGSLALYKGAQALAAVRGRDYAVPEDVKELVLPACVKRVVVRPESAVKGILAETVLRDVAESVAVPLVRAGT